MKAQRQQSIGILESLFADWTDATGLPTPTFGVVPKPKPYRIPRLKRA